MEFYTTQEVANIFKVTTKTIHNWDKEGTFVAETRIGGDRCYTRNQIEAKLGCSIELALDQIIHYTENEFKNFKKVAGVYRVNYSGALSRNNLYQEFYLTCNNLSIAIWRKNKTRPGNCLIVSPEISGLIESACAGFAPRYNYNDGEIMNTIYIGTINNKFKVYSTIFLEMGEALVGIKNKEGLQAINLFLLETDGLNFLS